MKKQTRIGWILSGWGLKFTNGYTPFQEIEHPTIYRGHPKQHEKIFGHYWKKIRITIEEI